MANRRTNSRQTMSDAPVAVAALVIALDKSGALSKRDYIDVLTQLWMELPQEDAFDEEAFRCQQLVEYLS